MKRRAVVTILIAIILAASLSACGAKNNKPNETPTQSPQATPAASDAGGTEQTGKKEDEPAGTRKITYLDKEYEVPAIAERIIMAGSMESMEDALVINVKPIGATTVSGEFPAMFASIMEGVTGVGEKTQPSVEEMLKLKPDVILASTKFPAESLEKFSSIATTIPVSHISTNWEANLKLLGELTGKQELVNQELQKYQDNMNQLKQSLGPVLKDKTVLAVRIRTGGMYIYPQNIFFNPSIYEDLGADVPDAVLKAEAQQLISLEMLTEINPDYLFIQFAEGENVETPKTLEELKNNPIFKSINAVKNDHLFVNIVDPIAQGGTAFSKIAFLEAVKNSSLNQTK